MPNFRYQAQDSTGHIQTGQIIAASRVEAVRMLQDQRLLPLQIVEVAVTSRWTRRVPRSALCNCYTNLSDLLESGMPLLKAVDVVISQVANPRLHDALEQVRDHIADGMPLAEAMRRQPDVFGELAANMVAVGEEGGFLENSLARIAQLIERQEELKGRLVSALAYPAFLAAVGIVVCCGMLVFFVPMFEPLFERMRERGELPYGTALLLSISGFARGQLTFALLLLALTCLTLYGWFRSTSGQQLFDRLRWNLIGVGPIVRDLTSARTFHILGTLLTNGVPMLRSLEMAERSAGNRLLASALHEAKEIVAGGGSLAAKLSQSQVFARDITEMLAIGEQSNRIEQVLINLANKLERRAQKKLDVFTKLLEPALMTVLAGMIGFLVIALLLPIFNSSGQFT